MVAAVPPPPIKDKQGAFVWLEWFRRMHTAVNTAITSLPWSSIDFTGSNITDIVTRNHNQTQSIQGGTAAEYYHLTSAEYTELQRNDNVTSTAVDLTLTDSHKLVYVTATGKTITLPAASSARIGKTWTVNFNTTGMLTIQRNGADTIMTPASDTDTSLVVYVRGTSVTFECLTATTWGIV